MQYLSLRVTDSLNFVMSQLSAFPKHFWIKRTEEIMCFPNFSYWATKTIMGPISDVKYYDVVQKVWNYDNTLKPDAMKIFLKWYADKLKDEF